MKYIIFDLDGTLLSLSNKEFEKVYFSSLAKHLGMADPRILIKPIWEATEYIIKGNNGVLTNEEVYDKYFKKQLKDIDINSFYSYYRTDFDVCKIATSPVPEMIEAISILKEKGYRLAIATNPLFPKEATLKRIRWAGLNFCDFELISTFEDFHHAKPDIKYYQEFLAKLKVDAKDCLMVGNNVQEDGIFEQLGGPAYLITDNLINENNEVVSSTYSSNYQEFLNFVKTL